MKKRFKSLQEVLSAIKEGKVVHWKSDEFVVTVSKICSYGYKIVCTTIKTVSLPIDKRDIKDFYTY